jgi:hypothetical protein
LNRFSFDLERIVVSLSPAKHDNEGLKVNDDINDGGARQDCNRVSKCHVARPRESYLPKIWCIFAPLEW